MNQNNLVLPVNANTPDEILTKLNSKELQVFDRLIEGQMYKTIATDFFPLDV